MHRLLQQSEPVISINGWHPKHCPRSVNSDCGAMMSWPRWDAMVKTAFSLPSQVSNVSRIRFSPRTPTAFLKPCGLAHLAVSSPMVQVAWARLNGTEVSTRNARQVHHRHAIQRHTIELSGQSTFQPDGWPPFHLRLEIS